MHVSDQIKVGHFHENSLGFKLTLKCRYLFYDSELSTYLKLLAQDGFVLIESSLNFPPGLPGSRLLFLCDFLGWGEVVLGNAASRHKPI